MRVAEAAGARAHLDFEESPKEPNEDLRRDVMHVFGPLAVVHIPRGGAYASDAWASSRGEHAQCEAHVGAHTEAATPP